MTENNWDSYMYLSPTDKVTSDEFNHSNCLTALWIWYCSSHWLQSSHKGPRLGMLGECGVKYSNRPSYSKWMGKEIIIEALLSGSVHVIRIINYTDFMSVLFLSVSLTTLCSLSAKQECTFIRNYFIDTLTDMNFIGCTEHCRTTGEFNNPKNKSAYFRLPVGSELQGRNIPEHYRNSHQNKSQGVRYAPEY